MPFYIWLAIFSLQPHKEERFMYPAYPFLVVNAAIASHIVFMFVGSMYDKQSMQKIPVQLKFAIALVTVIGTLSFEVGVGRTVGTVTAYSAPFQVYRALEAPDMVRPGDTVCLGKEWYRFPSSFFLPNGARAKFIKSEFSGLLPGEFHEAKTGFGLFPGTWLVPPGMNDRNEEDPGKYVCCSVFALKSMLTFTRPIYRTAHTLWTHICRDCRQQNWNPATSRMTIIGRKCPAHHFSILQGPVFWREPSGSPN